MKLQFEYKDWRKRLRSVEFTSIEQVLTGTIKTAYDIPDKVFVYWLGRVGVLLTMSREAKWEKKHNSSIPIRKFAWIEYPGNKREKMSDVLYYDEFLVLDNVDSLGSKAWQLEVLNLV